jgi:hypothetical protein
MGHPNVVRKISRSQLTFTHGHESSSLKAPVVLYKVSHSRT